MKIIIIAAVAKNNVIGNNGKMPWHSKEDLQHFKSVTTPHPVVMGRKTFESLSEPLSGRTNLVLTKSISNTEKDDVYFFNSIDSLLEFCSDKKYLKIFIIGGGEIYKQFINTTDELIISKFNFDIEGDTYFPDIDYDCWKETLLKEFDQFKVYHYEKLV